MPVLRNARRERFCHELVNAIGNGGSQGQAYLEAGYRVTSPNSADASASRMLRLVKNVSQRVAEIQQERAAEDKVTRGQISRRLNVASRIAEEDRIPAALVAAEATKAKLYGLFQDNITIKHIGVNEAQSTRDLAIAMLVQCNAQLAESDVDEGVVECALAELARHAETMDAIAHGRFIDQPKTVYNQEVSAT